MATSLSSLQSSPVLGKKSTFQSAQKFRGQSAPLQCRPQTAGKEEKKNCAINEAFKAVGTAASALALAASLSLSSPPIATPGTLPPDAAPNAAVPELGVLIKGQPVKDAKALLRYALPINNKPIQDIQYPLELISEDLRLPGNKALDPVERNVRQAARILNQNTDNILADITPENKEVGRKLLDKLQDELQEMQRIIERKERQLIPLKQKELLAYVGDIEESMVKDFPFEIPSEFQGKPWLRGRATLEMLVNPARNPNLKEVVLELVVDGYNAPITAGNFVDLVARGFYDGMDIQRADGFVVQTGDPEGKEEGFVDPKTGKVRTIPLEIFVEGDKEPLYHETTEELGRYKAIMKLPFNAFGTMAMAREEFDNDSASSQIFWLLKESELTPSSANILDGRYSVFGYITENEELLADLKVGDKIKSIKVKQGLDNLQNPTF